MTPDRVRDEARYFEHLALRYAVDPWYHDNRREFAAGKVSAFRSAGRMLRHAAADEEGFEVKLWDGGPRAVGVAS